MVVEGWGCFNLGHPLSYLLAKIWLRRLGGFATFPIQWATLEIQLQLPFETIQHIIVIVYHCCLRFFNRSTYRDNSIAAGLQTAGVHFSVKVLRSILHHTAQKLLSTLLQDSFTDSVSIYSFRSTPGQQRPMSGHVLQQEAGRGRCGWSGGWRFPFLSGLPPPTALPFSLFMWRLPFVSLGLTKPKHLLTDHAMHQLLQLRSWYAMWNVNC